MDLLKEWESLHSSRFVCYALALHDHDGLWYGEIIIVDEHARNFVATTNACDQSELQEQLATIALYANFF